MQWQNVVPKDIPLHFGPRDRFCGLTFTYLSSGKEDENCRPLDHVLDIPFILSAPFIVTMNFYIYVSMLIKITKNLRNTFLEPKEWSYAKNGPKTSITNITPFRKKGQNWSFGKGYSLSKMVAFGLKLKLPKRCEKRLYDHMTCSMQKIPDFRKITEFWNGQNWPCLLYTSPSPRDA